VLTASNMGAPVTLHNPASPAAQAYTQAARRLLGEEAPVTMPSARPGGGLFSRLFGKKAAAA
jgi:septum site-determining protein MinD